MEIAALVAALVVVLLEEYAVKKRAQEA